MSRQPSLYTPKALDQWKKIVAEALPPLSKTQARTLALWSFGMVLARCCALTTVALFLAKLLGLKFCTLLGRLREFYQDKEAKTGAKKGNKRRELQVSACFPFLLRWALKDNPSHRIALALDASTLGTRFVVLCLAVVCRGSAVPVAWKVLPAATRGAWKDHWLTLLDQVASSLESDKTVVVLADRGLYARWLFEGIRKLGWHPMLRINQGGKFRPDGGHHFVPLTSLVASRGGQYRGRGTAFSTPGCQLQCTLLACWGEEHQDPWLILTDLPAEGSEATWYQMRSWIEQFFKDGKRGGWQWQKTRMQQEDRVERLWLSLAVATLWLVAVGAAQEEAEQEAGLPEIELWMEADHLRPHQRWRLVSVFLRGWICIVTALLRGEGIPWGKLICEPWPEPPEHDKAQPNGRKKRRSLKNL